MGEDGPTTIMTSAYQDSSDKLSKTSQMDGQKTQKYEQEPVQNGGEPTPGLFSRLRSMVSTPASQPSSDLSIETNSALANAPRARREMIERVIAFDEKRIFDVMMPRADIAAVDVDTSLQELIQIFSEAGHSRMPVYRGDLDDPIGMVHIKDLIGTIAENGNQKPDTTILKSICRKVLYVPPSMRVVDLFLRMQASRVHMALVIDEYGGTDGLVTIEDLIEEIVGEIHDEHDDEDTPMIIERPGGGWDADARIELEDLAEVTGTSFNDHDDDVDTLGGLVFSLAGRVPVRGEVIGHPSGVDFEVTDVDARKIRKIRIRPVKQKQKSKKN